MVGGGRWEWWVGEREWRQLPGSPGGGGSRGRRDVKFWGKGPDYAEGAGGGRHGSTAEVLSGSLRPQRQYLHNLHSG